MNSVNKNIYSLQFIISVRNILDCTLEKSSLINLQNIFKIKNDCWRKHRKKICSSHEAIKLIKSSINKISIKNYDKISKKLKHTLLKYNADKYIECFIDSIFLASITQPIFCEIYAKLCKFINSFISIKELIIKKTKNLFYKENSSKNFLDNKNYNEFCDFVKEISQKKGNIELIVKFKKYNFLEDRHICSMITFLNNEANKMSHSDIISEYLYTIYKSLYNDKLLNTNMYSQYKSTYLDRSKNKKLKPKMRFNYLDIIDIFESVNK